MWLHSQNEIGTIKHCWPGFYCDCRLDGPVDFSSVLDCDCLHAIFIKSPSGKLHFHFESSFSLCLILSSFLFLSCSTVVVIVVFAIIWWWNYLCNGHAKCVLTKMNVSRFILFIYHCLCQAGTYKYSENCFVESKPLNSQTSPKHCCIITVHEEIFDAKKSRRKSIW